MGVAIILIFLLILFIIFVITAQIEKKNDLLMKEEIMPGIASKHGKVISVSADALRFERNETIFAAKISLVKIFTAPGITKLPEVYETEFEVQFNFPNLQEKFFIQHQSVFSKYSADCQPISPSAMPKDFIFHSFNALFLLSLLEKENIIAEIYKYPSDWYNRFRIGFENGVFILTWRVSGERGQYKAESLQQICQTAVIFHDELSIKTDFEKRIEGN
jgi:Na+-transporting methylmalonyl-CoA/oxaloacetate decarboxylase gamma subunit